MIRERTSAGLAAARAEGRVGGRRKKLDDTKRREIAEAVISGRKKPHRGAPKAQGLTAAIAVAGPSPVPSIAPDDPVSLNSTGADVPMAFATLRIDTSLTDTTQFADGGNLENTGIAALLAYSDIDSIIAFVNPMTVMQPGEYGVPDGDGGVIPGTKLIVDASIPPLFGYQPYETGGPGQKGGYVLYSQGSSPQYAIYANNQVFDSAAFPTLLQGLWTASGSGSYAHPAIYSQRLAVRQNTWFGVTSAREITIVWFYLSFVAEWEALFADNQAVVSIIEFGAIDQ